MDRVKAQQRRLHSAQGTQGGTVLVAAGLLLQSHQTAQRQPAASDAKSNTGAGDQLLARHLARLERDQGAQLTTCSAVDGM